MVLSHETGVRIPVGVPEKESAYKAGSFLLRGNFFVIIPSRHLTKTCHVQ